MRDELLFASLAAAWFGFLTSISPCPLAANIAAISFISRSVGTVGSVLLTGLFYSLGRTLTCVVLGFFLVRGLLAAPELSHLLQKYMNLIMGPLLIIVAMFLLEMLTLPSCCGRLAGKSQKIAEMRGGLGAFVLGVVFALSFCPTSAVLFFGSLLPLAVRFQSGLLLPAVFGVATGLPVLLFALLLASGANKVGRVYNKLAKFEYWAQRITGGIFLLIGFFMTLTLTMGIRLW